MENGINKTKELIKILRNNVDKNRETYENVMKVINTGSIYDLTREQIIDLFLKPSLILNSALCELLSQTTDIIEVAVREV